MTPGPQEPVCELQSVRPGREAELLVRASRGEHRRQVRVVLDAETCRAIQERTDRIDSGDRYRLSLRCRWDPFAGRYVSSVTRISHDRREVRYFSCSAQYRNILDRLENTRNLDELPCPLVPEGMAGPGRAWRVRAPRPGILLISLLIALVSVGIGLDGEANAPDATVAANSGIREPTVAVDEDVDRIHGRVVSRNRAAEEEGEDRSAVVLEPGETIYSLPEGHVALTFDDGPTPYTERIVDVLTEHEVTGNFFFVGEHVEDYPRAVQYAGAHDMVVGNHSWSHGSLLDAAKEDLQNEIVRTNELIYSLAEAPVVVFRPPYGLMDDQLREFLADGQMTTVMWNYDAEDWRATSADQVVDYVLDTDPCGGIYLLHETRHTLEALPKIIEYFRKEDVTPVGLQ